LPRPPRRRRDTRPVARPGSPGVALFVGCIAGTYEANLRTALARCLTELGIALTAPPCQTCCGSLHAHGGNTRQAQRLGARNRAAFNDADTVLTLASGCHESVAQALDGPGRRTVDAIAYLAERAPSLRFRPCEERIALHLPCTQRNVVRSAPALRRLLAQVPGLTVIELDAGYGCCGAAGSQMLDDPDRAARFRAPLLQQLIQSKATRLLSANIGCRLHFAPATTLPVQHPIEFLAGLLEPEPSQPSPATPPSTA
jgi:glycolate oxidase iron-sulfur subunit